jgi:hypothetical protein
MRYVGNWLAIRRLVWLMNRFPGIETEFSCAGEINSNGVLSLWMPF